METSYGVFERRIPLPEGVEDNDVKAEYTDGSLRSWCQGLGRPWSG
jgi:HSP20 family molecular chaperone IbpA